MYESRGHPSTWPSPVLPRSRFGLAPLLLAAAVLATPGCGHRNPLAPELASARLEQSAALVAPATLTEAIHREGQSDSGALWVIDAPAGWNGDLVVYCHGYTDPWQPISLPNLGAIRDSLLARGFAVAASSYSRNGYAVPEGMRDSHELSGIFRDQVAKPRRTFLMGQSLGGLIGMLLSQKFANQYDGSLLVAGIVGGSIEEIQYVGDVRVLFDTVYPGVLPGTLQETPPITNLNAQVIGPALQAINANPQGVGIIQSLARRKLPGNNANEVVTSLLTVVGFAVQGGSDLFGRTHEHSFFDNAGWTYTSPALPPALIADVNARVARYSRTPDAEAFLTHYGVPEGPFRIPVTTLHNLRDPVVPYFHEELLAPVAAGPMLVQRSKNAYGHTTFSAGELMAEFGPLVNRATPQPLAFSQN